MADTSYNFKAVYFPWAVAKVRLPLGVPAGREQPPTYFVSNVQKVRNWGSLGRRIKS